ncbi:Dal80p, partial [Ascoidea rubescens DSM 1968]
PTCRNCKTQTTPLWRRDETGQVLCNACGLFLKLHGRARPISLKTDIIKSRNRVKHPPNSNNSSTTSSSSSNSN